MSAEITTNKTVVFSLGGLHSTICTTNNISLNVNDLFNLVKYFRECSMTNDIIEHPTVQ